MAFESVFAMHAGARHLYRDQRDVETGNNGKMARRRRHRRGSAAESREKVHFHNRVKYFAVRLFQKSRGGLKNARARARARAWCLLRRCGKKKKKRKGKKEKEEEEEEESKVPSAERSEKDYWICSCWYIPLPRGRGNPFFGSPLFRSPFLFFTYTARGIMTKDVEVIYRFYRFFDRR